MGVTVRCTWVSKSTGETHKYRNCFSFFRQKFQGLKVCGKDWLQEGSSRCGTAFSTVWQGLQRPQRAARRLCWPGCLRKWWQQVFHTPGELTCGFSQFSVKMLTVVLHILCLILCPCFCFSALLDVSILGGLGCFGVFFFLPVFLLFLTLALFSSFFSRFSFWFLPPSGGGSCLLFLVLCLAQWGPIHTSYLGTAVITTIEKCFI